MVFSHIFLYIKSHCANTIRDHWNKWFHWISHSMVITALPLASTIVRRNNGIVGSRRWNGLFLFGGQVLFTPWCMICMIYRINYFILSYIRNGKTNPCSPATKCLPANIDMRCNSAHSLCICCNLCNYQFAVIFLSPQWSQWWKIRARVLLNELLPLNCLLWLLFSVHIIYGDLEVMSFLICLLASQSVSWRFYVHNYHIHCNGSKKKYRLLHWQSNRMSGSRCHWWMKHFRHCFCSFCVFLPSLLRMLYDLSECIAYGWWMNRYSISYTIVAPVEMDSVF